MELVGIIAIGLGLAGFIWKSPRHIMRLSGAASSTWVLYFLSLSQWGAALSTTFAAARFFVGAFAPDRIMRPFVIGGIFVVSPLVWVATPTLAGSLVAVGGALKGLSVLARDRVILFRVLFAASELCYLGFGLAAGAWSTLAWSVLSISMALGSALVIRVRSAPEPK